ncbi:MAG: hypothetical protein ACFCVK_07540 [Acidimicrobiales bacterium]
MPEAEHTRIEAARMRREALYQALVGLEDALSTPIGDGARWRLRVSMAVDHAVNRVEEHIVASEAADGVLAEVLADVPRLAKRARRLRTDHDELEKEVHALRILIDDLDDEDVTERGNDIRTQALEFLGHLALHRQRGADLVYEAYQVDIGASH